MANSYLTRTTVSNNRLQIGTLIGDLARSVALLTADIEHEEAQQGVRDLTDPAYPVLARTLRARRDNMEITIASLEALIQEKREAA